MDHINRPGSWEPVNKVLEAGDVIHVDSLRAAGRVCGEPIISVHGQNLRAMVVEREAFMVVLRLDDGRTITVDHDEIVSQPRDFWIEPEDKK